MDNHHTPGPWHDDGYRVYAPTPDPDKRNGRVIVEYKHTRDFNDADGPLLAAAPDLADQVYALTHGWSVEKRSLYDEEGVEGWAWIDPDGGEHVETGVWDDLPPWPESARAVVAKARGW